jgi:hypothetical protein
MFAWLSWTHVSPGALTGVKGGRRAPGYEVRLADPGQVKGMAIVTSSTANEFSQESDDLKGSFFSQSIMAGLRGAADSSHDGQVTLERGVPVRLQAHPRQHGSEPGRRPASDLRLSHGGGGRGHSDPNAGQ